jgi:CYTH domain-containing protein
MSLDSLVSFQGDLVRAMIALEDSFVSIATGGTRPALVLCDRGTMDCSVYVPPDGWSALLDEHGWSPVWLRDGRYEAVIHMVTAADGAEKYYTTENNIARTETAEQARLLDRRLQEAWVGHPHLRVIDNSTDFDGKVDRVVSAVCTVVGLPQPRAGERKFLVRESPEPAAFPARSEVIEIEQTYLITTDGSESRVRRRGQGGASIYSHSVKKGRGPGDRIQVERMITAREYLSFLSQADPASRPVRKLRRVFLYSGQYCELDTFLSPSAGLQVLEVEVDDLAASVELPPFVQIDREVTGEKRYSNWWIAQSAAP